MVTYKAFLIYDSVVKTNMKTKLFLLLSLLLATHTIHATHLRGGYIQVRSITGLTYEISVYVFNDEVSGSAAAAATTSTSLCFGDGTTQDVARLSRVFSPNKATSISTYRTTYTYAGPGTYTVAMSQGQRTGVLNIPSAGNFLMTLTTTFITGTVQTPTLSIPETGFTAPLNQRYVLPFSSADFTGDSLSYSLARPLVSASGNNCVGTAASGYQYPNDLTQQGTYTLNNRTAILVWNAPTRQGYYSVAITIREYRDGVVISQTQFEFLITVIDTPGTPGVIPAYQPATEVGLVTAIPDYRDEAATLTTFPNPVDDRLQVVIQSSNPAPATLRLTDMSGRTLHELTFKKASRQHEQVISMAGVSSGVYLLQAEVNGRSLVRKVVKK